MERFIYIYQYLFFRFYKWNIFTSRGIEKFPHHTALLTISSLQYINFLTILLIVEMFTAYKLDGLMYVLHSSTLYSKLFVLTTGGIFLYLNYIFCFRKGKYIEIIKKFENESKKSRIIGNIFTSLYVIGSFFFAGFSVYLLRIIHPPH